MKRAAGFVLAFSVVMSLVSGCVTTNQMEAQTPFEAIEAQEAEITKASGLAVVGTASSRTVHLALDRAQMRGREALVALVQAEVEAVKSALVKEMGAEDEAEIEALFAAASKQLAHEITRLRVAVDLRYETVDGMTSAWALMAAERKDIANALSDQSDVSPHLYTRFLASKTCADLKVVAK